VTLTLIYRMFVTLSSWIVLQTRSDTANEIEILVLRLWVPRTESWPLISVFAATTLTSHATARPA
jgi:hypothetical protein